MSPQTPIVNAPVYYVTDMKMIWLSDTQFIVSQGACRDYLNSNDLIYPVTQTCSVNVVGVNGMDLAVAQPQDFLHVFAIGDSSKYKSPAYILSLNNFKPALPYGYDLYKRIGSIKVDSSAHIVDFAQYGRGDTRTMYYAGGIRVYNGASSTTYTSLALVGTAGVTGLVAPDTATQILLDVSFTPASPSNVLSFKNPELTEFSVRVSGNYSSVLVPAGVKVPLVGSVIDYKSTSASDNLILNIAGYIDELD